MRSNQTSLLLTAIAGAALCYTAYASSCSPTKIGTGYAVCDLLSEHPCGGTGPISGNYVGWCCPNGCQCVSGVTEYEYWDILGNHLISVSVNGCYG